jgi:hypothetical protein
MAYEAIDFGNQDIGEAVESLRYRHIREALASACAVEITERAAFVVEETESIDTIAA